MLDERAMQLSFGLMAAATTTSGFGLLLHGTPSGTGFACGKR
jgi:hypothetical protein